MEESGGTKEREVIRATPKSECIGKAAPLPARGTAAAKTVSEKKLWTENDKRGVKDNEENNF